MDGLQTRLEQGGIVKTPARTGDNPVNVHVSSVQSVIRNAHLVQYHWKDVDLEAKRKAWEETTLEVANAQESSAASRKALAESTKNFRKLPDEEKLAAWGALLKSYQSEIDSLTKRCKAAELAFINVFKALRDVPDPTGMLSTLCEELENMIVLKTAYDKVSKELDEYKEEFQSLKNQDVTIRRLEEKIASLEEEREGYVAAALDEHARALEVQTKAAMESKEKKEKELENQVKQLKQSIVEMQRKNDEAQALQLENQVQLEAEIAAKHSQIDLLSEEVDRLSAQVTATEREKEQINSQYLELWRKHYTNGEAAASGTTSSTSAKVVELETALQSKEGRLKQLCLQVEILEESVQKERDTAQQAAEQHLRQLKVKEQEIEHLKQTISELPSQADYRRLKRQIQILQAVEYNMPDALESAMNESDEEHEDEDNKGSEIRKLEEILIAKNRQLDSKLTETKRLLDSTNDELKELKKKETEAEQKIAEQAALIAKLEDQLYTQQSPLSQGFSAQHLSALLDSKDRDHDEENVPANQNSLAAAVAEQRDRFRAANIALEAENTALKKRQTNLEGEIRTLRSDNVKMYEKIKYLESYRPGAAARGNHSDVEAGIDTFPHADKYKALYEESLNPFTVFNQKQRQLRKEKMPLHERLMLEMSQFFLGNSVARKFLFFYMVIMHILVFVTLYRFTHNTGCRRISGGGAAAAAQAAGQAAGVAIAQQMLAKKMEASPWPAASKR
ncbi:hypothetical protein GUITHDRAFT_106475 [Guillardia theta CCMP2712]|uniref:Protein CASP n=1 Tax=Guillardia theta (strain CCMP2712) TaxID=905079 RepID=L1JHZ2_GUITC|nr:hypothetical protein GUITHDRAFT_106475 [Guillardia theta CCMP2712]EKX47927.1 hypothetical protein GUITHDRAFT_106475 [Guillardia theta CCMP2712]|eukprot:XP_005834907.1 hypothetical protein GUITHDRAFT_106475 [Guillardia theta CCMP2712]